LVCALQNVPGPHCVVLEGLVGGAVDAGELGVEVVDQAAQLGVLATRFSRPSRAMSGGTSMRGAA